MAVETENDLEVKVSRSMMVYWIVVENYNKRQTKNKQIDCRFFKEMYLRKVNDKVREISDEGSGLILQNEFIKMCMKRDKFKNERVNIKKLWVSMSKVNFLISSPVDDQWC